MATAEEYTFLKRFDRDGVFLFRVTWSIDRPLSHIYFWIPYIISPDSFFGFGFILAVTYFGKALFSYLIIRIVLPGYPLIAFISSVLFIVYPLDPALLLYRTINIHLAIFWVLIAIYCLLRYWNSKNLLWWVPITIIQSITLLGYEGVIVWVALAPILIIFMTRQINRRIILIGIIWNIIPLIVLIRILVLMDTFPRYATGLVPDTTSEPIIGIILNSFIYMYRSHLEAWGNIFDSPYYWNLTHIIIAVLVGVLFGIVAHQHSQITATEKVVTWKIFIQQIAIGLLLMFVGFIIYSISNTHRFSDWRVFLMTSLGAGYIIAVLINILSIWLQRVKLSILGTLASSILVSLSVLWWTSQHQLNAIVADDMKQLLSAIVSTVPELESTHTILLIDEAGITTPNLFFAGHHNKNLIFGEVLQYVYQKHRLRGHICYPQNALARLNSMVCQFETRQITFPQGVGTSKNLVIPYENLLVFVANRDGTIKAHETIPREYLSNTRTEPPYHQVLDLVPSADSYPDRAYTLFECFPVTECTNLELESVESLVQTDDSTEAIFVDFTQSVTGDNWLPVIIEEKYRWMNAKESTVQLTLPKQDFILQFKALLSLKPEILESLTVSVNELRIPLTRNLALDNGYIYQGRIPYYAISSESFTTLTFHVDSLASYSDIRDGGATQPLGVLMEWIELQPLIR